MQHCEKNGRYNFPFPPLRRPNRPVGGWEDALADIPLNRSDRANASLDVLVAGTREKGLLIQEYGRITNRLLPLKNSHGSGVVDWMVTEYTRLLIPRPPLPSIKVLDLLFVFSVGCNFYDRCVLPHAVYEQTDRNSNVDQKLRTRTSERFNPIENEGRHCRMLNAISLGDDLSTCQQVYSPTSVFLYSANIFFEFFSFFSCFLYLQEYFNDVILITS